MLRQNLVKIFESLLEKQGLSPYRVALDCGIDPNFLRRALKGEHGFSDAVLQKLSEHPKLNVTYEQLKTWKIVSTFTLEELIAAITEAVGLEAAVLLLEQAKTSAPKAEQEGSPR
jgi:transcriptional regulator with XRE-family HTH domain